jgi:hypothetical protein
MSSTDLKYLTSVIAYTVCRAKENGIEYETLRKRLERFDEKSIKSSLENLTSKNPPLLIFNKKNNTYRASPELERILNNPALGIALNRLRLV